MLTTREKCENKTKNDALIISRSENYCFSYETNKVDRSFSKDCDFFIPFSTLAHVKVVRGNENGKTVKKNNARYLFTTKYNCISYQNREEKKNKQKLEKSAQEREEREKKSSI